MKLYILAAIATFLSATLCFVILQPLHNTYLCLATILLIVCLIALVIIIFYKMKWFIITASCLLVLLTGIMINHSTIDKKLLSTLYVEQLHSFHQSPYVWGGESGLGVDCSGLPRKSMINALLLYALYRLNGGALFKAIDYWWHDASAYEMSLSYKERMVVFDDIFTVNKSSHVAVQPGDLAVTKNGTHVMVYLNAQQVIQAEPGAGQVIIDEIPSRNAWLNQSVKLVRWSVLNDDQ